MHEVDEIEYVILNNDNDLLMKMTCLLFQIAMKRTQNCRSSKTSFETTTIVFTSRLHISIDPWPTCRA